MKQQIFNLHDRCVLPLWAEVRAQVRVQMDFGLVNVNEERELSNHLRRQLRENQQQQLNLQSD